MDAIKFLTRQHREVEALFGRYERSPSNAGELFGQIERAIIPHAIIEEQYIYPMLKDRVANGDMLAEHAIHEHAEVEQTLNVLGTMTPGSLEFQGAMQQVMESIRRHVHEEEESPGLFAMLRATLNQRELNELGRTLERAADMTPTRAHPLAPDHPPANQVLGLPLAVVDRLRDRVSGRAQASAPAERRVKSGRKRRSPTRKVKTTRTATRRSASTRSGRAQPKRAATRRRKATAKRTARARTRTTRARRR